MTNPTPLTRESAAAAVATMPFADLVHQHHHSACVVGALHDVYPTNLHAKVARDAALLGEGAFAEAARAEIQRRVKQPMLPGLALDLLVQIS